MLFLLFKKARGISKSGFILKDQSVTLNFELSYNERTLAQKLLTYMFFGHKYNMFSYFKKAN